MSEEYVDDQTIENGAELWRRIHPSWCVKDDNQGITRVSSAAFDDSEDGTPLSVLLASLVIESGRDPVDVLEDFASYSLASITAGLARSCGQRVMKTPEPYEAAHASVIGPKTKSIRRALARGAIWVVAP
jgi:hypothetical protein